MGLAPSLSVSSFSTHNIQLHRFSTKEALRSYLLVTARLHNLCSVNLSEVIDVTVTLDGTWSWQGHAAHYVMVVVIT